MCEMWMDVDTALSEVPVNVMPLMDDTTFKDREEAVAYNAAGLELIWHFTTTGGATTATVVTPTTGGAYDWAHQGGGMYTIAMPASEGASVNNDTEGFGWFTGVATGVLPWRGPIIGFRAAGLNNALIDGGDTLDVNVTTISGDTTAADNCESFFDGTGYADANNVVTLAASQGNYAPAKAGDAMTLAAAYDAAKTAATQTSVDDIPTVAEFEARTIAAADYLIASDTLARVTLVDTTTTNTDMVAAAPSTTDIKTAMESAGSHLTLILEDTGTTIPALLTLIQAALATVTVTVSDPVATDGTLTIYQGDGYLAAKSRELSFEVADESHVLALDAATCTVQLYLREATWTAASVTSTAAGYTITFEPTYAQTAALAMSSQSYHLAATYTGTVDHVTLGTGVATLVKDIAAVS